MRRLLFPLAIVALLGCSEDPGGAGAAADTGDDAGIDLGGHTGDVGADGDLGTPGDLGPGEDLGPHQDTGPDDTGPQDAGEDVAGDTPDDVRPDEDASDADAPDADPDTGPALPVVQWADRRGLSVAGKRAVVLRDTAGRPVVVAPRGGIAIVAYAQDGAERWSLSLLADPLSDVAAAIGPDDVLYLFFDFRSLTVDGERLQAVGGTDLALLAISPDGQVLWHELWGTEDTEYVVGLGVDDEGGIYLAGYGSDGTLEIGGDRIDGWPSPFEGFWDPAHFLVGLDSDRRRRWAATYGFREVQFSALTTAPNGTTFVGGSVRTDVDFGSGPTGTPEDGVDLVFAAFSAQGQNLWASRLSEPGAGQVLSLGVDGQGRLLATAALTGNRITSGNVPSITNRAGGTVLAFDEQGRERFRRTWQVASLWVASRCGGGPILAGHTVFEAVDFGGGPLPQAGVDDAFLVGLDDDGTHIWSLAVGTRHREVFTGAAGDARRRVAFGVGIATGGPAPDYGAGPTEAMSDFDAFIVGVGAP